MIPESRALTPPRTAPRSDPPPKGEGGGRSFLDAARATKARAFAPAAEIRRGRMGGPGRGGSVWPSRKRNCASKPEASRTTAAFSVRRLRAQGCFPLSGSLSPREPRKFGAAFACVPTCLRTKEKPCRRRGVARDERGSAPALANRAPADAAYPSRRRPTGGGREEDRNLVSLCQGGRPRAEATLRGAVECADRETPRPSQRDRVNAERDALTLPFRGRVGRR